MPFTGFALKLVPVEDKDRAILRAANTTFKKGESVLHDFRISTVA